MKPSIETCIRMYNANKDNDLAVFMVFQALSQERVLMAVDNSGNLMGLPYQDDTVIPIFTSPDEIDRDEPIATRAGYLRDAMGALLASGEHIVVNPFSSPDIQFIIPHKAIAAMLKPLADGR